MIYGRNFGHPPIPPKIRRMFAPHLKPDGSRTRPHQQAAWVLVGVATNPTDRDRLIKLADDGHRKIDIIEREGIYALYEGWNWLV